MNTPNRVRKNEIKFGFNLDSDQKEVKSGVYEKDITIILGDFGSGKTACAAQIALDLLFKGYIDRIFITRPIDFNSTGFLKGDINEKLAFHLFPIKQNLYASSGKEKIDKLFSEGAIQIVPIDYMKGMTFVNACTIVDEFEDIPYDDFKLILTRLGKGSKLIFTGSEEQTDIRNSCISKVKCLKNCDVVNYHVLTGQHRNENIQVVLDFIKENT